MHDTGGICVLHAPTAMAAENELHKAARTGDVAKLNRLIKAGANVNVTDEEGETPLFGAAYEGHTDAVIALLEAGAYVNAVGVGSFSSATPLHKAANEGHTDAVIALLKAGADVNATDEDGNTPLHWAAYFGHTDAVVALLKAGADVNATGCSRLHTVAPGGILWPHQCRNRLAQSRCVCPCD